MVETRTALCPLLKKDVMAVAPSFLFALTSIAWTPCLGEAGTYTFLEVALNPINP